MSFNELNNVEHYIVHQLSGPNLNSGYISEMKSTDELKCIIAINEKIIKK